MTPVRQRRVLFTNLIVESLSMAWQSIQVNKLRAVLTLFGLSIGIFSIVAVFTAVDALERGIRQNVASLGSDVLYIQKWPWSFESDYQWWEYVKRPVPTYSDYEAISKKITSAEMVAFSVSSVRTVKYGKKVYEQGGIWANTYDFIYLRSFEIEKGRYFSPAEYQSGKNICLLGADVAQKLFDKEDALDQHIVIDGKKIKVVGVLKKEGAGLVGGSLDNLVLLPMTFARNVFDIRSDNLNPFIMVKAREDVPLDQLREELRSFLRKRHGLKPGQKDDFSINQSSMIIAGINQIFKVIHIAGWIIGGFSLLVGGFGIANIMFVSVKERTNQIGIQKALGAKNIFILLEFLFEGVILALCGGLVGILLVFVLVQVAQVALDFPLMFTLANASFGLLVATLVGIVSALWPAYTAARLNPVEAINTTF
ncbi:MAG TPA: ABC transporter permease [Bacteroidales bacterium]|nr:ABC transporter permease [Bacteroidales bacterium]HOK97932.1 ABC transporter permease [Bacteroidales bacterium]HPO64508.1 ABC transporter permease [Bacteroidales bacterium]